MNITEPRVELIAHTTLACDGRSPAIEEHMSLDPEAGDMQQLVFREPHKGNPVQDVDKHIWYAQRYRELLSVNKGQECSG